MHTLNAKRCQRHVILLVRHGIHSIENLYLEELARDHVYAFTFICVPPKLKGATGSPVRPLAVVQQYQGEAASAALESPPVRVPFEGVGALKTREDAGRRAQWNPSIARYRAGPGSWTSPHRTARHPTERLDRIDRQLGTWYHGAGRTRQPCSVPRTRAPARRWKEAIIHGREHPSASRSCHPRTSWGAATW
jgi:hypothetical protein